MGGDGGGGGGGGSTSPSGRFQGCIGCIVGIPSSQHAVKTSEHSMPT